MLLPFYSEDLGNWRYLFSSVAAIGFVVFMFWHLNLHYMNLGFAVRGYRVFTVYPPNNKNPHTDKSGWVVITRRVGLSPGDRIIAYRLSDTVYMETQA